MAIRPGSDEETGERGARIQEKLARDLEAVHVEVVDESHLHAGHPGARSGGGHFRATIVSPRFEGMSKLEAQRLVYRVLAEEMEAGIHALSMATFTPEKWADR
jgi:BolA protein